MNKDVKERVYGKREIGRTDEKRVNMNGEVKKYHLPNVGDMIETNTFGLVKVKRYWHDDDGHVVIKGLVIDKEVEFGLDEVRGD